MSTTVSNDTRVETVKQLRKLRLRRLGLRLFVGVGLPTLLGAVYYGLIATPRYESVTAFTIQSADGGAPISALQMLVASVPGSATRDVLLVEEYVRSRDMLRHLVAEHEFVDHFSSADADFL